MKSVTDVRLGGNKWIFFMQIHNGLAGSSGSGLPVIESPASAIHIKRVVAWALMVSNTPGVVMQDLRRHKLYQRSLRTFYGPLVRAVSCDREGGHAILDSMAHSPNDIGFG